MQEKFDIKSIFLGRDSVPETIDAITNYPNALNDWVTTKTKDPLTYTKIAEMLVDFSQYFKESAEENGLDYVSLEDNFTETLEELVVRLSTS